MIEVRFHDQAEDSLLKFAVILARSGEKWVFCKHRERTTLEIPGGHREPGESIGGAAARELREETGARSFTLRSVCVYSVFCPDGPEESFGALYWADITGFDPELHSEIEKIVLLDAPPADNWTYPEIQPALLKEAQRRRAHATTL